MKRRKLSLAELLIALAALVFVFPVAMIFIMAFKPDGEVIKFESILPRVPTLGNFQEVLGTPEEIPLLRWFLNSLGIATATSVLVLTVSSLSAYAFARLDLPGKKWVFPVVIGTLMVPGQILLVPVYLELNALHWLDTPLSLIVPVGGGAFGFFMLHSFFTGIPRELEEAAELDGCSRFGIFWNVVIPLARAPLAALAIFTFVGSWNDFLGPLVYLDSVDHYTLPVGVALFQSSYASEYGLTLAAGTLCTLPTILAFLIFQRHILAGMAASGLKE
ncbi:carbohydrate ABC transporter permease [Armatimonas rosea]|uniref:Multiple sugar transport system permease protein n=1 Tax=Armatimonas rosea TaxID=685828 RepID=A0A7W9W3H2_ARMRO|nr:carbohydrate ABC transporter permease [Armatimonas rosea]MBB6048409.1 multiple sugar transport system permease protein [Armatimonas rosea]